MTSRVGSIKNNNDGGGGDVLNTTKESLNSVYGNQIGIFQTISLILNCAMIIYAHVGTSAVILSNQKRLEEQLQANNNTNKNDTGINTTIVGACTAADRIIWENGANQNRSQMNTYCATQFKWNQTGSACLIDKTCIGTCFHEVFNYTPDCASCFSGIPQCGFQYGCTQYCGTDPLGAQCETCNKPCTEIVDNCTGLTSYFQYENNNTSTSNSTMNPNRTTVDYSKLSNEEICTDQQAGTDWDTTVGDRSQLYVVYTLTFFHAVQDAWEGHAKILAILVVLFSGVWPYAKNFILLFVWYTDLSPPNRNMILTTLKRIGKYTFVDVYIIIVIMVGVLLQLSISNIPVIVTAEPRPAIISFLFAALWESLHSEWMMQMHHHHYEATKQELLLQNATTSNNAQQPSDTANANNEDNEDEAESPAKPIANTTSIPTEPTSDVLIKNLKFQVSPNDWYTYKASNNYECVQVTLVLVFLLTIALYIGGSITDLISFTSYNTDDTSSGYGCAKHYNLFTFGTELVTETFLTGNSAKGGTWILCLCYIQLVIISPIIVHFIQFISLTFNHQSKQLCRIADANWAFASVEILLLGIILIQYKFDDLVGALAGNDNSQFFGITSELGTGFYILIGYSVLAAILQYVFNSAASEFYLIDPFHKIDYWWTNILGCILQDTPTPNAK